MTQIGHGIVRKLDDYKLDSVDDVVNRVDIGLIAKKVVF